ncbi:hypothetical protein EV122DRAFT_295634 [Schizophyllum commune]
MMAYTYTAVKAGLGAIVMAIFSWWRRKEDTACEEDPATLTSTSARVVRTADGHDAILRVIATRLEGRDQLHVWRTLATPPYALLSDNHTLPMLREIQVGHVSLGMFPLVSQPVDELYGCWAKSSVGDVLDVIAQALEALSFIHELGVAHRDAFKRNFVMEWYSESLLTGAVPVCRPRVYIIDFEMAIQYAPECPASERTCVGPPCPSDAATNYAAQRAPEVDGDQAYSPFKLDIWQLGASFQDFDSTLPAVQCLLADMVAQDPSERPTAAAALRRLRDLLANTPPGALLTAPIVLNT